MAEPNKRTAGAFDIRVVIGALLAIYGLILLGVAIFASHPPQGTYVRDNLWAAIVLLAVAALFLLWARLRPVVVKEQPSSPPPDDATSGGQ